LARILNGLWKPRSSVGRRSSARHLWTPPPARPHREGHAHVSWSGARLFPTALTPWLCGTKFGRPKRSQGLLHTGLCALQISATMRAQGADRAVISSRRSGGCVVIDCSCCGAVPPHVSSIVAARPGSRVEEGRDDFLDSGRPGDQEHFAARHISGRCACRRGRIHLAASLRLARKDQRPNQPPGPAAGRAQARTINGRARSSDSPGVDAQDAAREAAERGKIRDWRRFAFRSLVPTGGSQEKKISSKWGNHRTEKMKGVALEGGGHVATVPFGGALPRSGPRCGAGRSMGQTGSRGGLVF